MVSTIVASLGQLTSHLNTIFAPAPPPRASSNSFDATLSRLVDSSKNLTPGLATSLFPSTVRSLSIDAGRAPDQKGVLAILTKYPATNDGILKAMPELQRAYHGVKLLMHPLRLDKLEFADGTIVDTIVGAGAPGSHWGWGVEEHGTGHVSGLPTVDLGGLDIPRPGNMKYKYDWVPTAIRDTMTPVDAYPPGRFRHQLSGFNPEKIGPNSFHSMNLKYVAARVFEQIDVYDVGALDTAVARLRAQGLDATKVGDDKIDFGDGQGPIDVIRNMSDTPTDLAWHWRLV